MIDSPWAPLSRMQQETLAAMAHGFAKGTALEFMNGDQRISGSQCDRLERIIERRLRAVLFTLAFCESDPKPRTWDYPIGDPPPYRPREGVE